MDLGCPPLRTFLTITLPLIWPAVASGWMLAFALSLDDLVIASFVTGPGATTPPAPGTSKSAKPGTTWEKGATGYGVRLLDRFIADNYEA